MHSVLVSCLCDTVLTDNPDASNMTSTVTLYLEIYHNYNAGFIFTLMYHRCTLAEGCT